MTDCLMSCEEYLAEQNRKVIKIKQDGNCFYSTLSFELFGKQDEDAVVRDVISRMVLLNKNIFSAYFIPMTNVHSIHQHCECNWMSGTWATLVEVIAAATVFSVPVYFLSQTGELKWNEIHPLKNSLLRYPEFPDMHKTTLLKPSHFELLYYENLHYDAIVATDTGRVSLHKPVLIENSSQLIDLCN